MIRAGDKSQRHALRMGCGEQLSLTAELLKREPQHPAGQSVAKAVESKRRRAE